MGHGAHSHRTRPGRAHLVAVVMAGVVGTFGVACAATPTSPATPDTATHERTDWEHLRGGGPQDGFHTAVAATAADEVWVFSTSDSQDGSAPWLLLWDGQEWRQGSLPDGLRSAPTLADSDADGQVWALAYTLEEGASATHYDGESWSMSEIDPTWEPTALAAVGDGSAWMLARTSFFDTHPAHLDTYAAHFDGHVWNPRPAPTVTSGLDSSEDGEVFAVGDRSGELTVERWDGSGWVPEEIPEVDIPGGEPGASFNDVLVRASDDVWAVGNISWKDADEHNHQRPVLAHYDGTEWTIEVGDEEGSYEAVADDGGGGLYLVDGHWNTVMEHRPADEERTRQELVATDHDIVLRGLAGVPEGAGAILATVAMDKGDPDEPTGHGRVYGIGSWY